MALRQAAARLSSSWAASRAARGAGLALLAGAGGYGALKACEETVPCGGDGSASGEGRQRLAVPAWLREQHLEAGDLKKKFPSIAAEVR